MVSADVPLHEGDNIVLLDNFDFSQSIFDIDEPDIAPLSDDFLTPRNIIKKSFENYGNFLN